MHSEAIYAESLTILMTPKGLRHGKGLKNHKRITKRVMPK